VPETVSAAYRHIEEEYLKGPYAMGDTYSIADPYLFTFAQWMEPDGVNPMLFPKVREHRDMMRTRPVVQKVLEDQFR